MNLAIDCAFQLLATEPPDTLDTPQISQMPSPTHVSLTRIAVDNDLKEDSGVKSQRGVQLVEWVQLMRTLGTSSKPVQYMWCAAFTVLDTDSSGFLSRAQFAKVTDFSILSSPLTPVTGPRGSLLEG